MRRTAGVTTRILLALCLCAAALDLPLPARSDARTRVVPVVVITSSKEDRDVAEAYKLGVNSYIVKPIEFDKLVVSVGQLGLYWLLLNHPPAPSGA